VEERACRRVPYRKVIDGADGAWAIVKGKPRPFAVEDLWIEPRIEFPQASIGETGERIVRVIQTTGKKAGIRWTIDIIGACWEECACAGGTMLNNPSNTGLFQINVGGDGTSEAEGGCCHPRGAWIGRMTTSSDDRSVDLTCHAGIELDANDAFQQLLSSLGGRIRGALTSMMDDLAIKVCVCDDSVLLGGLLVIIRHTQ